MPEREDPKRRTLDLDSELGVTRRDLLRRGAVVGGTLLWVAPAIQSLSPVASAQAEGPTPGVCAACYCWSGADKQDPRKDFCTDNGRDGHQVDDGTCNDWCLWEGDFSGGGAPNGPYASSQWCSDTTSCICNSQNDPGENGTFCS